MQIQNVEEVGCVYKRVKKGRGRRRFDFERNPALKIPAADGAVLLKPLPAVKSQATKIPRNTNGSAQWSPLCAGMGLKNAYVGDKF